MEGSGVTRHLYGERRITLRYEFTGEFFLYAPTQGGDR
jgi:hypothetical protein